MQPTGVIGINNIDWQQRRKLKDAQVKVKSPTDIARYANKDDGKEKDRKWKLIDEVAEKFDYAKDEKCKKRSAWSYR